MSEDAARPSCWQPVIDRMFEELRSGAPRAETYWVQQLAFGPVFFYAVALAVRGGTIPSADLERLRQMVPQALSMLGALPDGCDGDPASFFLLARRQAQVLAWGRRHHLMRLAARLGLEITTPPYNPVPGRWLRPYELIGWNPSEPTTRKKPLKELLPAMPSVGEDSDFERDPDFGRKVDL